jgi:hypothetical protein
MNYIDYMLQNVASKVVTKKKIIHENHNKQQIK